MPITKDRFQPMALTLTVEVNQFVVRLVILARLCFAVIGAKAGRKGL